MAQITFHGGVKDIGGNKFLVEDKGTMVFMDFGMSFSAEKQYFSEYLKARGSNNLIDMIELGLLPNIKGLYRRDYARHMNFGGDEDTQINAVLLTHAHSGPLCLFEIPQGGHSSLLLRGIQAYPAEF